MEHVSRLLPAIAEEKQIRKSDLRLIEAAAVIRQEPMGPNDWAFMAKELVQCTLPHRDPGDVARWSRRNPNVTLTMVSSAGYPFGSIPRLLLFWLTKEAKRTGSRNLKLGRNFRGFLKELGFGPYNGTGPRSNSARVKEQMRRLFTSTITFSKSVDGGERWSNMLVADDAMLWWNPARLEQDDLWESWVLLGERFFAAITADPVPLDCRALKALKRSPLALDLYAWAVHKIYSLKQTNQHMDFIYWKWLHTQFGADYSDVSNFRLKALAALKKISVLTEFHFVCMPGGMMIYSDTALPIAPRLKVIAVEHKRLSVGQ
jgi:hypothetical protein